jgi:DNA-binding HxlR family transcriptional regulator
MNKKCDYVDSCPLRRTINVIRKKWALLIINAIGYRQRLRFNELMDILIDISPKALSDTLKELEAEGLIKRESFAEIPPRVEYVLTNDGAKLRDAVLIPLLNWIAERNGETEENPKICQRLPTPMWIYPSRDSITNH